jgi:hypothetical protein
MCGLHPFAKKPLHIICGTVLKNLCPHGDTTPVLRTSGYASRFESGLDLKGLRPCPLGDGGMQKDFTLSEAFCVPLR